MYKTTPIVTDICWTLYRSNTTFDFLDSIIHKASYRHMRSFFKTGTGRGFNILLYRLTHIDWQRRWAIRYLKGISEQTLAQKAEQFVQYLEQNRRIDASFAVLSQLHAPIILLSGTLDCVADAVGKHLHAQAVFSSTLEYRNGVCTGKMKQDLLLKKTQVLPPQPFYIITDNKTDLEAIKTAAKAYIVCYSNQAWWEKQSINHIVYIHENGERY